MRKLWMSAGLGMLLVAVLVATAPAGSRGDDTVKAKLIGFNEVPSVSTPGHGSFKAKISDDSISYRLEYSDLEDTATAAHIHFAQEDVNGGIVAFLCGGDGAPACPPSGGTVTGTITADDIIGPSSQGIAAREFDEAVRAIRSGNTYANVHSETFPGGEIRGQIDGDEEDDDEHHDGERHDGKNHDD